MHTTTILLFLFLIHGDWSAVRHFASSGLYNNCGVGLLSCLRYRWDAPTSLLFSVLGSRYCVKTSEKRGVKKSIRQRNFCRVLRAQPHKWNRTSFVTGTRIPTQFRTLPNPMLGYKMSTRSQLTKDLNGKCLLSDRVPTIPVAGGPPSLTQLCAYYDGSSRSLPTSNVCVGVNSVPGESLLDSLKQDLITYLILFVPCLHFTAVCCGLRER